jgi:hypothetical protein
MREIIAAAPAVVVLLVVAGFLFAVVMQPIFVWMICSRLKKTNRILSQIADSSQHTALVNPNPIRKGRAD